MHVNFGVGFFDGTVIGVPDSLIQSNFTVAYLPPPSRYNLRVDRSTSAISGNFT
jgi:hypothetical protein